MPIDSKVDKQTGIRSKRVMITIAKDLMTATMVLRPLSKDDPFVAVEEVMEEIEASGIVYGIDREQIDKSISDRVYNQPIKIATGKPPARGQASQFEYHFDTSADHKPAEDEYGHVDYKAINFIQNTSKGDVLATKSPPQSGKPGTNVKGSSLAGPPGRDIPFKYGHNTAVSEDGFKLLSTADGAIVYANDKISVNDVTVVNGDVDFSVGNIDSRGSIRISGGIKTGFTVKTDGDLEIGGNVGDSHLQAKGNIMIRGAVIGTGRGQICAEGDITVKFAQGARITAGGNVFAGDELINCHVTAKENVTVRSRIGKIVGGEINAGKEIRSAVIGTDSGTTTIVRVGYDSELAGELTETINEIKRLNENSEQIRESLLALNRLKLAGKLTEEKAAVLEQLKEFRDSLPANLELLQKQKVKIEGKMAELRDSRIIADSVLHAGTMAYFGIVYRDILEDHNRCCLENDGTQIFLGKIRD